MVGVAALVQTSETKQIFTMVMTQSNLISFDAELFYVFSSKMRHNCHKRNVRYYFHSYPEMHHQAHVLCHLKFIVVAYCMFCVTLSLLLELLHEKHIIILEQ